MESTTRERRALMSRQCAHQRQMYHATCLILWIGHRHAGDGSRVFREHAGRRARLSSASPNSSRRSARACRAVRAHHDEWHEMETCPYNEPRRAVANFCRTTRWIDFATALRGPLYEMETCPYSEPRSAVTKTKQRPVRQKVPGNSISTR